MQDYQGIPLNWQLPKIEKGQLVRFIYWDSKMKWFQGWKGYMVGKRPLSAKPLKAKTKRTNDIRRGNELYYISIYREGRWQLRSFYNHRMCNLEILDRGMACQD